MAEARLAQDGTFAAHEVVACFILLFALGVAEWPDATEAACHRWFLGVAWLAAIQALLQIAILEKGWSLARGIGLVALSKAFLPYRGDLVTFEVTNLAGAEWIWFGFRLWLRLRLGFGLGFRLRGYVECGEDCVEVVRSTHVCKSYKKYRQEG